MPAPRVLAAGSVYDDVVSGLAEQARGLVIGDTLSAATTPGPGNSARHRHPRAGCPERRPDRAEIVTGGREPDRPGFFLEPTVVAGLQQDDELIPPAIFRPPVTAPQFPAE